MQPRRYIKGRTNKQRNKMLKSKQPTDPFQLKKIENKIEKANKKIS